MESNNELKEIDIKNRTYCHFDNLIRVRDFDFGHTLLHKKSYENILIYDISYKTFMDEKPLRIRFNKVHGFIKICDRTRYLILFGPERYNAIYDRSRYLISEKSGITITLIITF